MSGEVIFLIGTLCLWLGALALLHSAGLGLRLLVSGTDLEKASLKKSCLKSLITGGVLLALGVGIPTDPMREATGSGLSVPIVWVILTVAGWAVFLSILMAAIRAFQGFTAIHKEEVRQKLGSAGIWLAVAAVMIFWHERVGDSVEILRGVVAISPGWILAAAALAVGAVAAMSSSSRAVASRGWPRKIVVQVTLIVGCLVFGVPFAWLISTSFKEQEDMTLANGIHWIPRVQVFHEFEDRDNPLVEARTRGRNVKAGIVEVLDDGKVLLEIERPYGLRGRRFETTESEITPINREVPVVTLQTDSGEITGFVASELDDGSRVIEVLKPESQAGERITAQPGAAEPVRKNGLRWQNYTEAMEFMPEETFYGLVYLKNTLVLVIMSVIGTILSCSLVAYGFSRLRFPGGDFLFGLMLATMMLPAAVTMLPTFLIFKELGWVDTLLPIWVPTFFAQAFNVFLLRQFFRTIPMELEDAAKIDGCSYLRTYWQVMLPMIKPALAAISIWTFMGAWNNFMGPLIYVSSPDNMPIAYALQLFQGERGGEYGMMMAFSAMATVPVVLLFFVAQRWFIEGVQLSGLGGR
jgi:multiple sugar transport system permease protein